MRGERRSIWIGFAFTVLFTVLAFVSIGCVSGATTASEEEWNVTFGGSSDDEGYSVQQTTDGGYIIACSTWSFSAGNDDLWLLKVAADGTEEWNRTFGGTSGDECRAVQQTTDGGYILAGTTYSFGAGWPGEVWLLKTAANGSEEWNRTFGGASGDWGASVQQTIDGGYIVAGGTFSYGAGNSDFWLVKTDSKGIESWNRTYGGGHGESAKSVQQITDGGYIVAGITGSYGAGNSDFWLIKADANGSEQWNRTFGNINAEWVFSVQQTLDGGYIIAGWTQSFGAGGQDCWLVKTDPNGLEQWNKTFGGASFDSGESVQQTTDGGYIVAGYTYSFGVGDADGWLLKTAVDGTEEWNRTFGGASFDSGESVQQTTDGGYIIAGRTESFGAGGYDVWLIKVEGELAEPYTKKDIGVISNISSADPEDMAAYLPPEYDGVDISDAVVLNVNVTDDTPGNTADDAYTDITITVGAMDVESCKVFKSDMGFLPEVTDITTLPTVKPPGEPAFSRNVANNTVTIRMYAGDPLLAVLPPAAEPPGRWDINEDCTVNFIDLTILSAHWLETPSAPYPRYDINEDGMVNFIDLTILSAHWLETTC